MDAALNAGSLALSSCFGVTLAAAICWSIALASAVIDTLASGTGGGTALPPSTFGSSPGDTLGSASPFFGSPAGGGCFAAASIGPAALFCPSATVPFTSALSCAPLSPSLMFLASSALS